MQQKVYLSVSGLMTDLFLISCFYCFHVCDLAAIRFVDELRQEQFLFFITHKPMIAAIMVLSRKKQNREARASRFCFHFSADAKDLAGADHVGILDAVERLDLSHGNLRSHSNIRKDIAGNDPVVDRAAVRPEIAVCTTAGNIIDFLIVEGFDFIRHCYILLFFYLIYQPWTVDII